MRLRASWTRTVAAAFVFIVLAVACAPAGTASPKVSSSPGETASPSPSAGAGPSESSSGQTEPHVTVAAEREKYAAGEPIHLQIHNGLMGSIATVDQQAFCGVLRLDKEISPDTWQEVRNCQSGPPPQDVVIGPGQEQSVTWETGLGKGVYRARLVYTIGGAFVAGEASEVTTGRLTVG